MKFRWPFHKTGEQIGEEAEEVELAKKDPSRFAPLYERYHESVVRFIYQRIDKKDLAFDIAQQVFLKAMLNLKKYQHRGLPFSAWLFRIAQNELNMIFRRTSLERVVNLDTPDLMRLGREATGGDNVETEDQKLLLRAISALPPQDLEMIEMRFFEKRSFREIGDIAGITENNAKVRTYRILERMKQFILKHRSK